MMRAGGSGMGGGCTHAQLLQQSGLYQRLHAAQFAADAGEDEALEQTA